jgi:hypothetical protein
MEPVRVRFAQAARKHRIGKAHALAAMERAGEPIVVPARDDQADDRLLFIGEDDRGVELEVIAVQLPDCLLVIHVMPYNFRRKT